MANESPTPDARIRVPVRPGPYQYVRVRAGGEAATVPVSAEARARGTAEMAVRRGDLVLEIALKSTSDPDLDPARGQLWPETDAQ